MKNIWFQKYIKAIHRSDQCQALADECEAVGSPKANQIRNLQNMYLFLAQLALERLPHLKRKIHET